MVLVLKPDVSDDEVNVEAAQNEMRVDFLSAMQVVLKTAQTHELNNEVTQKQIARFRAISEAFAEEAGTPIRIAFTDESTFVSQKLVKVDASRYEIIHRLREGLIPRNVGEVVFVEVPSEEDLYTLSSTYKEASKSSTELGGFKTASIELRPTQKVREASDNAGLDARQNVIRVYGKSLILMSEFYDKVGEGKPPQLTKLRRLMQEIIDISSNTEHLFLGIIQLKEYRQHLFNHCVNVAILSVMLGKALGMDKKGLVNLGLVALTHDIGKASLPTELQMGRGEMTDQLREQLADVPLLSFFTLLKATGDEAGRDCAIVGYEHSVSALGQNRIFKGQASVLAQIVAIANDFDTFTTKTDHNEACTPDEALRRMRELGASRYNMELLEAFVGMVGIYPIGSTVWLNNGEIAVVFNVHDSPHQFMHPVVRIVNDRNGQLPAGTVVDLWENKEKGRLPNVIAGAVDMDVLPETPDTAAQQIFFA